MRTNHATLLGLTAISAVGIIFSFASTAMAKTDLSRSDQSFMTKAAQAGMAEVRDAEAVADRTQNEKVTHFANHMIHDHRSANEKLMDLADEKGLTLPSTPNMWQQHIHNDLTKLNGKDLDQSYIKEQVKDHKSAVSLFEDAAKNAKDDDVRRFAAKTLPTLREHLREVKQIQAEIKE